MLNETKAGTVTAAHGLPPEKVTAVWEVAVEPVYHS